MNLEVTADCDECYEKINLTRDDMVFCRDCHDSAVDKLENEGAELRYQLDTAREELSIAKETIKGLKSDLRELSNSCGHP